MNQQKLQIAAEAGRNYQANLYYLDDTRIFINSVADFVNEKRDKSPRYYASTVIARLREATEKVKFCSEFQIQFYSGRKLGQESAILDLLTSGIVRATEKIDKKARKWRMK